MPISARTIGGPGGGKTHRAMEIISKVIDTTVNDPHQIGFVSFTRAARREASTRAAERFGCTPSSLEKDGWFKTLHAVAYKQLGVAQGELLLGGCDDNEWLREALDDEKACFSGKEDNDDYLVAAVATSDSTVALALWDAARNCQAPLEQIHERASQVDSRIPDLDDCQRTIDLYEEAKKRDGRLDFCDLLMRFAGRKFTGCHGSPFARCLPDGLVPCLQVWMHDEAQDMSRLTALVFRRLIEGAQYVYLMGDHWQTVYNFCGSDGSIFSEWPVQKEEVLPTSYRCRQTILDYANAIMHRQEKPRAFSSQEKGGTIDRLPLEAALDSVKPGEDVLILARTNEYAREAAAWFDSQAIPWRPIKGSSTFCAPARAAGVIALEDLRQGRQIDGNALWRLVALLPSKADGVTLFERGTKSSLDDQAYRERLLPVSLLDIDCAGATEAFKRLVSSGDYLGLLEPAAQKMAAAARRHGTASLGAPTIRIGTGHCSPPDEPVLTNQGWIPIGSLEPGRMKLAGYYLGSNKLVWGGTTGCPRDRSKKGFEFIAASRPYSGKLITLETASSKTRVTPEHRLLVRFTQEYLGKYAVYLMRRGNWFRVGMTRTGNAPYNSSGISTRISAEIADAAWILGVFDTKHEALYEEKRIQGIWGIPGITFEGGDRSGANTFTSAELHPLHDSMQATVYPRAMALLEDFGLLPEHPLYQGYTESTPFGKKKNKFMVGAVVIRAVNFLPRFMLLPVATPGYIAGTPGLHNPIWLPVTMSVDDYNGPVHSLTVPPHEFYISGRAVVHNSAKGLEADRVIAINRIPYPTQQAIQEPEGLAEERRVWYVVASRARWHFTIAEPDAGEPFEEL